MERIDYIIGLIVILVIAAGIYFGVFYSPTVNIVVTFRNTAQLGNTIYPYQNVALPIQVNNTGSSAVTNMNVEIDTNGELSSYYKVTLPAGKETVLNYNFTPAYTGEYNISATVDPGHLYNIADRQDSQVTQHVEVSPPGVDQPYTLLPNGNYTSRGSLYATDIGFEIAQYLLANYSISLDRAPQLSGFDSIFLPLFNIAGSYINSVSIEYANYSEGSYAYSVWFNGYLSQNVMTTAMQGYEAGHNNSLTLDYKSAGGSNITVASFGGGSSLCSYYSDGWTKNLFYHGGSSCYEIILNETANGSSMAINQPHLDNSLLDTANLTELANFTYQSGNSFSYGQELYDGSEVVLPIVSSKPGSSVCYGLINYINDTSYCSYFVSGTEDIYSNTSLIGTYMNTKQYNISVLGLENTSTVLNILPPSFAILDGYNMSKESVNFTSGLKNTCSFGDVFGCSNATFTNSSIGFDLLSNKTVTLNSIDCYEYPQGAVRLLNTSAQANTLVALSSKCYDNASLIAGIPLNLNLDIVLNYTVANKAESVNGTAYIVGLD